MIGMQEKGVLEVSRFGSSISPSLIAQDAATFKKDAGFAGNEPVSVLDTRSPSPSTSSSSLGGRPAGRREVWTGELHTGSERFGLGFEDWEWLLSGSGANSDDSLLRWMSGDLEDPSLALRQMLQEGNQIDLHGNVGFPASCSDINNGYFPPTNLSFQEQNHQNLNPQFQNAANPAIFSSPWYGFQQELHPSSKKEVIYDHVYKAAGLILSGQFSDAEMILARLNHQLSPAVKPLQRAAFYFKEALHLPLILPNLPPRLPTPLDGVLKMGAYKVFSEVSPFIQFMNFTSNQAILEALDDDDDGNGSKCIHIFDFDIVFGAQWSSFMQELPRTKGRKCHLKITAFASPSTHHPAEIKLMHQNLTQFADEAGVEFELEVVNIDTFDPSSYPTLSSATEVVAVNFPLWSVSRHRETLPLLLHYIKQLSPRVVVSFERGYERAELPFPHHLINSLKYFEVLFESIEAANVTSDASDKIGRFLFQHSIESIVSGHIRFPDQMPPWRNLFASAGFLPLSFSSFAETQAECVVRTTPARGFHVEKCQLSLTLFWKDRELLSASAWRC